MKYTLPSLTQGSFWGLQRRIREGQAPDLGCVTCCELGFDLDRLLHPVRPRWIIQNAGGRPAAGRTYFAQPSGLSLPGLGQCRGTFVSTDSMPWSTGSKGSRYFASLVRRGQPNPSWELHSAGSSLVALRKFPSGLPDGPTTTGHSLATANSRVSSGTRHTLQQLPQLFALTPANS